MFERDLFIDFLSDWHVGSGLNDGAIADSILNRDADGLPYIPGRAIKGALREGAWRLGMCREDLAKMERQIWGAPSDESNVPGRIMVAGAHLPADLSAWLLSLEPEKRKVYVGDMTILRAQTKLDEAKRVVAQSLRSTECCIPGIRFISHVRIDAPDLDKSWLAAYLDAVCAAVKSMGADRARGLGYCRMHMDKEKTSAGKEIIRLPRLLTKSPEARS